MELKVAGKRLMTGENYALLLNKRGREGNGKGGRGVGGQLKKTPFASLKSRGGLDKESSIGGGEKKENTEKGSENLKEQANKRTKRGNSRSRGSGRGKN